MNGPTGYWYLDSMDVWSNFAIGIKDGTAGFLQTPEKKDSITHDWPDQHGIDVDLSKIFFKSRDIVLQCWLITETETEFWNKRNAFIQQLAKPGVRRFSISAHGGRSYYVFYKSCSAYRQVPSKTLKGIAANMIVHEFAITLTEPSPQLETADTFIASDLGEFIII
jgi:hypothetical protein